MGFAGRIQPFVFLFRAAGFGGSGQPTKSAHGERTSAKEYLPLDSCRSCPAQSLLSKQLVWQCTSEPRLRTLDGTCCGLPRLSAMREPQKPLAYVNLQHDKSSKGSVEHSQTHITIPTPEIMYTRLFLWVSCQSRRP